MVVSVARERNSMFSEVQIEAHREAKFTMGFGLHKINGISLIPKLKTQKLAVGETFMTAPRTTIEDLV